MGLRINDEIPNLTVTTDQGEFALHDWIGDSWAILFSHPKDFHPPSAPPNLGQSPSWPMNGPSATPK